MLARYQHSTGDIFPLEEGCFVRDLWQSEEFFKGVMALSRLVQGGITDAARGAA
jgi:hypothetical protein